MPNSPEIKPLNITNITERDKNQVDDQKETPELNEVIIDSLVEHMLLESAKKINEGNNGVIFLVDFTDIDEEMFDQLKAIKPELMAKEQEDVVIKMLKVYTGGQGKREFIFQKKAYEAIKRAKRQNPNLPLAEVPAPYFYRELNISQNTALQKKINAYNINCFNQRIEIILMDFIPGKDLASFLYQEVLKYHPETKYLAQTKNEKGLTPLEEMDIEELQAEAARALKFSYPPDGEIFMDDRIIRIFNENKQILINFLKKQYKHGFKMPKDILTKIENTIKLFHQNGFEHNDLHERNIIIGADEEIYIIDFGAAKTTEERQRELKGVEEDIKQAELGHVLRDDQGIIQTLKELSIAHEEEVKQKNVQKVNGLISTAEKIINRNPTAQQELASLNETTEIDELLEKIYLLASSMSSNLEAQAQIEAGLWYKFLQKNKDLFNNEQLKKIYTAYKKRHPYQQKLISLIIKEFMK